ncbi:MAG TPA: NAD+ synthase [Myxococcota bacterium]|nr:NAD+ synthase [Myxococcota bacterium]
MRVALGQLNTTIGDFAGNLRKIRGAIERARAERADVVVLPELAVCGYPPGDLLERPTFLRDQTRALEELVAESRDIAILTGAVLPAPQGAPKRLSNAAVLLDRGEIAHVQTKTLLPTYDVFDEARYFQPAAERRVIEFRGRRVGIAICEDVWSGKFWGARRPYPVDPVEELVARGAEVIWTISASPWNAAKMALREAMLRDAARQHRVPLVFVNLVGGNDELIFDGTSFAVDADARVVTRLARFAEDFAVIDPFVAGRAEAPALESDVELLERALVLGIRDYLGKLGLRTAVIGLSGGIDSAVTAHLAVRALGPANVAGLLMPGPFSSEHSVSDAEALARNLGIEARTVRIDSIYKDYLEQFRALFGPRESYGLTQENVQARIRGALLMAVSNAENRIVLATGNKSELSMGYTTLYGDLVGGLAVLGDVLKRDVYAVARFANRNGERIPLGSIDKPPSAELAPGQKDSDSLPPYPVLDEVLHQAIELGLPGDEIEPPPGATRETVAAILRAIDRNEYKRRQAPVVLRVSQKAYGSGRRIPIVHRSGWGV